MAALELLLWWLTLPFVISDRQSLSPSEWAVINSWTYWRTNQSDIELPSAFFNSTLGTMFPIIVEYDGYVHVVDTNKNRTLRTDKKYSGSPQQWEVPQTSIPISNGGSALSCVTTQCHTIIEPDDGDVELYVIFDNVEQIAVYDLDSEDWEISEFITFEYPGVYCLANNKTHIFAVGDDVNILIIDVGDGDNRGNVSWSTDYIFNGEVITCTMDAAMEYLYIFGYFGVFKYAVSTDELFTIYDRDFLPPYTFDDDADIFSLDLENTDFPIELVVDLDSVTRPTSALETDSGWIWIKDDVGALYAFSSVTDSFLNCRYVPSPSTRGSALIFIDDVLFEMGGALNSSEYITDITAYDLSWRDDSNFAISDWYYPGTGIEVEYSNSFRDSIGGDDDDTSFIRINLTSNDFDVDSTFIRLFVDSSYFEDSYDGNDTCEVCYDETTEEGECNTYCLSDGIAADLMSDTVQSLNENHDVDISTMMFTMAITTTTASVSNSDEIGFLCNSFAIYPVYLVLNITLLAEERFHLSLEYEYQCNNCNVTDFTDGTTYQFVSNVSLQCDQLGLSDLTLYIVNGESCILSDGEQTANCSDFMLMKVDQLFFDAEYAVTLQSNNTFLVSDSVTLSAESEISGCPWGTGYDSESNSCSLCDDGSFSVRSDTSSCVSCAGLDGITCEGGTSVWVDYRYWVSGYREVTDTTGTVNIEYVSLFNMTDDHKFITAICGFGQCCSDQDGCDFVTSYFEEGELCASHRDRESAMCTACDTGYYELLGTNDCGYVHWGGDHCCLVVHRVH